MAKSNGGRNASSSYRTIVSEADVIKQNTVRYKASGTVCDESIVTTRDKAALVFHEYVRHREWTTDWLAYLGVFVALMIALVTSEFTGFKWDEKVIVSGGVAKGVVLVMCGCSFLASCACVVRRCINHKKLTCEYFLEQLKKDAVNVD